MSWVKVYPYGHLIHIQLSSMNSVQSMQMALFQYLPTLIPIEVQSSNITFCIKNKFFDIGKMWFPMDRKGTWMSLSCPWQVPGLTVFTRHDHKPSALGGSQLCSAHRIQDMQIWNEIEMHCPVEFQQAVVSLFVISASQPHNHCINLVWTLIAHMKPCSYTTHHIILWPPENKWTPPVLLENYLFGNPKWEAEVDELLLKQS
jgi:hypothetical protein